MKAVATRCWRLLLLFLLLAVPPLVFADLPCNQAADYSISKCTTCSPDTTPCWTYQADGTCSNKFQSDPQPAKAWGELINGTGYILTTAVDPITGIPLQAPCVKKFRCRWLGPGANPPCRTFQNGVVCPSGYNNVIECIPPPTPVGGG